MENLKEQLQKLKNNNIKQFKLTLTFNIKYKNFKLFNTIVKSLEQLFNVNFIVKNYARSNNKKIFDEIYYFKYLKSNSYKYLYKIQLYLYNYYKVKINLLFATNKNIDKDVENEIEQVYNLLNNFKEQFNITKNIRAEASNIFNFKNLEEIKQFYNNIDYKSFNYTCTLKINDEELFDNYFKNVINIIYKYNKEEKRNCYADKKNKIEYCYTNFLLSNYFFNVNKLQYYYNNKKQTLTFTITTAINNNNSNLNEELFFKLKKFITFLQNLNTRKQKIFFI